MWRLEPITVLNYKDVKRAWRVAHIKQGSFFWTTPPRLYLYEVLSIDKLEDYSTVRILYSGTNIIALLNFNDEGFKSVAVDLILPSIKLQRLIDYLAKRFPKYVLELGALTSDDVINCYPVNLQSRFNKEKYYQTEMKYYVFNKENVNCVRDAIERTYFPPFDTSKIKFKEFSMLSALDTYPLSGRQISSWGDAYTMDTAIGFNYFNTYASITSQTTKFLTLYLDDIIIAVLKWVITDDYFVISYIDVSAGYKDRVIDIETVMIKKFESELKKLNAKKRPIRIASDTEEEAKRNLSKRVIEMLSAYTVYIG